MDKGEGKGVGTDGRRRRGERGNTIEPDWHVQCIVLWLHMR